MARCKGTGNATGELFYRVNPTPPRYWTNFSKSKINMSSIGLLLQLFSHNHIIFSIGKVEFLSFQSLPLRPLLPSMRLSRKSRNGLMMSMSPYLMTYHGKQIILTIKCIPRHNTTIHTNILHQTSLKRLKRHTALPQTCSGSRRIP